MSVQLLELPHQFVTVKDFGSNRNLSVVILQPGNIFCNFLLEIQVTSYW